MAYFARVLNTNTFSDIQPEICVINQVEDMGADPNDASRRILNFLPEAQVNPSVPASQVFPSLDGVFKEFGCKPYGNMPHIELNVPEQQADSPKSS
jgi:hypothetical protein